VPNSWKTTNDLCNHSPNSSNHSQTQIKGETMTNLEIDYKETELKSEHNLFRKWTNTDGSIWYTDLNCNYVGDDLEESLERISR
jgi:hypothetical protein